MTSKGKLSGDQPKVKKKGHRYKIKPEVHEIFIEQSHSFIVTSYRWSLEISHKDLSDYYTFADTRTVLTTPDY